MEVIDKTMNPAYRDNPGNHPYRDRWRIGLLALLAAFVGPIYGGAPTAATGDRMAFASPPEALNAVVTACEHDDIAALLKIFGPDGKDIVESGDKSDDDERRAMFVRLVRQKNRFIDDPMNPNRMILSIGSDDWPFPIPLIRKDGQWHFDTASGREEILARRIGSNELNAIEVCHGYVESQYDYAHDHLHNGIPEYAQRIVSSDGKQDGLYWETKPGGPVCGIPKGFAKAAVNLTSKGEPYHGYYFRILTSQGPEAHGGALNYIVSENMIGGFALIGWPAEYGVSGIQTFLVNHDGIVYEKQLGKDTEKIVAKITAFNPDKSWRQIQSEP